MIGRSSPFAIARVKNVRFSSPRAGSPKEIFETPSTVLHPSVSCTIRTALMVSYAVSCSADAVNVKQSINTRSLGMP